MTDFEEPRTVAISHPQAIDDVETALFDGEAVLFSAQTHSVHRLGPVAGAVWLMCDGVTPVEEIVTELTEAFGEPASVIRPAVEDSIRELAVNGLLVGTTPPEQLRPIAVPDLAFDGTPVITPNAAWSTDEPVVYVGRLALRLGSPPGIIVIVAFDSEPELELCRTLLQAWIAPEVNPDDHDVTLGVRTVTPKEVRGLRLRAVPHVVFGDTPMARARSIDDIVRALAALLGGIHFKQLQEDEIWLALRLFARDDRAVLTDLPRPLLLNDPLLADAGIIEVTSWLVLGQPNGSVVIAPSLPRLAWSDVDVDPPDDRWHRYRLNGAVARTEGTPAAALTMLGALSPDPSWFQQLATLAEANAVQAIGDVPGARRAIRDLLVGQ